MLKLSIIVAILWSAACTGPTPSNGGEQAPATAPATAPAQPAAPPPAPAPAVAVDPEIDELLTRLEAGAKDLTSFAAKITYEKEQSLLARTETRTGEIIYRIEAGNKSFAVLFDKRMLPVGGGGGGARLETRLYHYVFDGRWLAEIDHEAKQFIKREIVPPGKVLDPLKLGEGPFPLPIGQAKADVLARFDVTRLAVPADGLLKTLQNVDGLLLTPKPGTPESRDFKRVEIFYDRDTLLPVGINAIETNDDRKTVKLTDPQRNPKMDDAMLRKLSIAEPDPRQWKIDIRPWKSEE